MEKNRQNLLLEAKQALCDIVDNEDMSKLYIFNRSKGSIALPKISVNNNMIELNKSVNEAIKRNHAR